MLRGANVMPKSDSSSVIKSRSEPSSWPWSTSRPWPRMSEVNHFEVLAIAAPQPTFLPQFIDLDGGTRCEAMLGAEDESELFCEQRPAIETLPGISQVRGDGELGVARLEKLDDLERRAAQQFQLEAVEQPVKLGQM